MSALVSSGTNTYGTFNTVASSSVQPTTSNSIRGKANTISDADKFEKTQAASTPDDPRVDWKNSKAIPEGPLKRTEFFLAHMPPLPKDPDQAAQLEAVILSREINDDKLRTEELVPRFNEWKELTKKKDSTIDNPNDFREFLSYGDGPGRQPARLGQITHNTLMADEFSVDNFKRINKLNFKLKDFGIEYSKALNDAYVVLLRRKGDDETEKQLARFEQAKLTLANPNPSKPEADKKVDDETNKHLAKSEQANPKPTNSNPSKPEPDKTVDDETKKQFAKSKQAKLTLANPNPSKPEAVKKSWFSAITKCCGVRK